jgi:hypothetical protein
VLVAAVAVAGCGTPGFGARGEIVYVSGVWYGDDNPDEPRLGEIFLMDDDGSNQRQLTDFGDRVSAAHLWDRNADLSDPVLSPDGRRIAFVAEAEHGEPRRTRELHEPRAVGVHQEDLGALAERVPIESDPLPIR